MTKRLVEVFSAGCPLCDETVKLVQELACDSCEVQVWDLRKDHITDAGREKLTQYGIHQVPTGIVNGKLADCYQIQQPITREALIAAGIGQA